MHKFARVLIICLLAYFAAAGAAEPAKDGPTKERAAKVLLDFQAALEAKDYAKATMLYHLPPDNKVDPEKVKAFLAKFRENEAQFRNELSRKGIESMAAKGVFGKMLDVNEKDGKALAKSKIDMDRCYGLIEQRRRASFFWDGKLLKVVTFEDIEDPK